MVTCLHVIKAVEVFCTSSFHERYTQDANCFNISKFFLLDHTKFWESFDVGRLKCCDKAVHKEVPGKFSKQTRLPPSPLTLNSQGSYTRPKVNKPVIHTLFLVSVNIFKIINIQNLKILFVHQETKVMLMNFLIGYNKSSLSVVPAKWKIL